MVSGQNTSRSGIAERKDGDAVSQRGDPYRSRFVTVHA
jgi:hypothetical protein